MATERLHKVMSRWGVAALRRCEQLVRTGHVKVNGQVVTAQGASVDPLRDVVTVDGQRVGAQGEEPRLYLMVNKPEGYMATTADDRQRRTVLELLPEFKAVRLVLVGRLEFNSEGLVLLTNDGDLVNGLSQPQRGIPRTYHAKVRGEPNEAKLQALRSGVLLDDGPSRPCHVQVLSHTERNTWLELTLGEGRNRQVRRMCELVGHPVLRLVRTSYGGVELGTLGTGEYRELTRAELTLLRRSAGLAVRPGKGKAEFHDDEVEEAEPLPTPELPMRRQRMPERPPVAPPPPAVRTGPRPAPAPARRARTGERPSRTGERPSRGGERPSRTGERPSRAGERPSRTGERPSRTGERPSRTGERPSRTGERPSRAGERPSRTGERPAHGGTRPERSGARPERSGPPSGTRRGPFRNAPVPRPDRSARDRPKTKPASPRSGGKPRPPRSDKQPMARPRPRR